MKSLLMAFCMAVVGVSFADVTVTARVLDPRFGDSVSVSPVQETYASGTEVTVTATLAGETVYKRWYGLPAGAVVTVGENTVEATFSVGDDDVSVVFHSAPTWQWMLGAVGGYTQEDGTFKTNAPANSTECGILSNRVWQLVARKRTGSNLNLGFWTSAYTDHGDGVLDLSGPISDASGKEWVITGVGDSGHRPLSCLESEFSSGNHHVVSNRLTTLVIPETLETIPSQLVDSFNRTSFCTSLTNIIIVSDALTRINQFAFRGAIVSSLVLRAPNLLEVAQGAFWNGKADVPPIALNNQDAGEFDLSSLTNIVSNNNHGFDLSGVTGVYRLPKLLKGSWILSHPHNSTCSLEIGTGWDIKDKVVLTLSPAARNYYGDVTFGPYADITNTFVNGGLKSITFQGRPFDNLDAVLKSAYAAASRTLVYASRNLGWQSVVNVAPEDYTAAEVQARADIELALVAPEKVLSLYQDSAGARKAWIIHRHSPFDPKGLTLFIR